MIILHFHLQPQFKNELFHIYFTSYIFLASQRLVPVFEALFSSIHGQTLVMMSCDS